LHGRPTDDELRATFASVLDQIVTGAERGCPSDTGLDMATTDVLDALGAQPNPKSASDILACRTEFARQLDGTHAREARARERDFFLNT
jgi:hypothetical protein